MIIRTAKLREFDTLPLDEKFHELFKDTFIAIRAALSLIVGGIYHLRLYRDLCTFCEIDANNQTGKERIINTIDYLAKKSFEQFPPTKRNWKLQKVRSEKGGIYDNCRIHVTTFSNYRKSVFLSEIIHIEHLRK